MRERGMRIFDKRLKFKRGLQRELLGRIKERSELSWSKLAGLLNISEYTLKWDLYTEKNTFPERLLKKILNLYPVDVFENVKRNSVLAVLDKNWGQKKAGEKNLKQIKIPKESEDFAEFLGVMLGDGHLNMGGIRITGNALEKLHYDYIKKLIKDLFGLDSRVYISYNSENTIVLNIYSIELANLLSSHGLAFGNKIKNKSSFPGWVFGDKKFMARILRGLFDTDGGIYQKQKGYKRAIVEFQTDSPSINRDIIRSLSIFGFKPSRANSYLNIRIQDQEDVHRFFRLIGSSNPKNIVRYKEFLDRGFIPKKDKIDLLVKKFNDTLPFSAPRVRW